MQDDKISQSVDGLVNSTAEDGSSSSDSTFSLGINPSQDSAASDPAAAQTDDSGSDPVAASTSSSSSQSDDLAAIKQQALTELSPIINELDQTPEEKYRTVMMLIQASDDQSLIKSAYEAANKIEDKKTRAEALLNIVNEINYFSGQGQKPQEDPAGAE